VDQAGLAQVVQAIISEDLGSGLEPDGLGGAGLVELGDEDAQGTEQGPAGMDDLDLTVALEGLGVSRQTSSILYTSRVRVRRSRGIPYISTENSKELTHPAVVTRELSSQV
jgi:hypothetical protein